MVYGIASDEVLLQYAVSPFSESNTIPAFHSIAHRNNHIKIVVINFLHLGISLFSAIFLGCRKFCDYRLTFQFFLQGIIDMLGYCLVISAIKLSDLLSVKPNGIILQLYFKMDVAIICRI